MSLTIRRGREGSFGEQLEKLNRHQNLDGNGIQGYNSSTMYKKDGKRGAASENLGLLCSPQKPSFALGRSSPKVHAAREGL